MRHPGDRRDYGSSGVASGGRLWRNTARMQKEMVGDKKEGENQEEEEENEEGEKIRRRRRKEKEFDLDFGLQKCKRCDMLKADCSRLRSQQCHWLIIVFLSPKACEKLSVQDLIAFSPPAYQRKNKKMLLKLTRLYQCLRVLAFRRGKYYFPASASTVPAKHDAVFRVPMTHMRQG